MINRQSRSDSNPRRDANDQVALDAAIMREVLTGRSNPEVAPVSSGPFLVMLSGLPGTGKSYFARELVKQAPLLVMESDRLRKALVYEPRYTRGEHSRVSRPATCCLRSFWARAEGCSSTRPT